jgi:hypothetical protein
MLSMTHGQEDISHRRWYKQLNENYRSRFMAYWIHRNFGTTVYLQTEDQLRYLNETQIVTFKTDRMPDVHRFISLSVK